MKNQMRPSFRQALALIPASNPRAARAVKAGSLLLAFSLSGCAPLLQSNQNDIARLSASLNDMRALQAEQVTELSELKTQIRELSGRIDEIEHTQSTKVNTDISAMREGLSNLQRRVPPPAIVPVAILEEDEIRAASFEPAIAQKVVDALRQVRGGEFSSAASILEEALDGAFDTEAAPVILYWLALSEEGANDNPGALKHYAELVGRFPKSSRAPQALLRQGSIFIRLGDKKAAQITFKKLIAEYPKSADAARARERLKDL